MCYPHFTDKGSEDQQVWFTCLRLTWLASHRAGHQLGYSALSNPELSSIMWFFFVCFFRKKKCCEYVFSLFIVQLNIFFFKYREEAFGGIGFCTLNKCVWHTWKYFLQLYSMKIHPTEFQLININTLNILFKMEKKIVFPKWQTLSG